MTEMKKNDFGIPLHCVDCPFIAPTLDEVRDLETVMGLNLATSVESEAALRHLLARKMVKLSVLISHTDSCPGLVPEQYVDDDWATIDILRCQSPLYNK